MKKMMGFLNAMTHLNIGLVILFTIAISPVFVLAQSKSDFNHSKEILNDEPASSEVVGVQRVETKTGIVRAIYRPDFLATEGEPLEMARQYLNEKASALFLKQDFNDLEHKKTIETPGGYKVQFKHKAAGYPVYGSEVKVSINRQNEVVFVTNSYKPLGILKTEINTSEEEALQISQNHIGIKERTDDEKVETIVYNLNRFSSVVSYKVNLIATERNYGDWEFIINAGTGEILRAEDKTCYHHPDGDKVKVEGSAWVFDPDPVTNASTVYGGTQFSDNNDADSDSLTAQLKTVVLNDISFDGTMYRLEGPYAVIADFEAPFTEDYEQESSDFYYTRSDEAFEAANVYFHLDKSMRYMNETLGFDVMPTQYEGGILFDPHGLDGEVNAHYTYAGKIAFGSPISNVDLGEDPAVIIHELGHGLHDWITNNGLSQVDGLSEGLSDYWAQSYTRSLNKYEPDDIAYDYFGVWGGQNWGSPSLRVTNFDGHYPEALNGSVHHDGQMWSSSLMSIYDLIGKEATDMNCWEGISMLGASSSQVDAAYAFIQAENNLYGGIHIEDIFDVFYARGYLAGSVSPRFSAVETNGEGPRDVVFTDESFSILNEIVSWEWDFNNDGITDSNEENPSYTFTEVGAYTVSLTVSDGETTESIIKENYITVNGGFFVFEGRENQKDYSGAFIHDFLVDRGHELIYSNYYPSTLEGFDAAFLSFGNYDSGNTVLDSDMANIIIDFLEAGGYVYLEGGDVLGWDQAANSQLLGLFGLTSASDGDTNPIDNLEGQEAATTDDMMFTGNNQNSNSFIDIYVPDANAKAAFIESEYGTVAVQNNSPDGHRTFCFSYALSQLIDEDPHSSRYNILINVLEHFGYSEGDDYVVANFLVDQTEGLPGDEFNFEDWSISDEGNSITSWAWDFDGDGEIDSDEQNPVWSFANSGEYDVTLVVSNGLSSDTLSKENVVLVRGGTLVFEEEMNGLDLSGTFIYDYLQSNGFDVTYVNEMPHSLLGYDAVFASFGSSYPAGTELTDEIASTIIDYLQEGGRMYLEGANAFGQDQQDNNLLLFTFGLENVNNGSMNELNLLSGMEGSIMQSMEFNSSNQIGISSIDTYEPYEYDDAQPAFEESDYGVVALQFDGTEIYGQKTFCMSYSLANLDDGNAPGTRTELLQRVIDFFFTTTGVSLNNDQAELVKVYPNPAKDYLVIQFETDIQSSATIEIFDIWGKSIMVSNTQPATDVRLDIGHLPRGTYFYRISTGTLLQTGKIIIAR